MKTHIKKISSLFLSLLFIFLFAVNINASAKVSTDKLLTDESGILSSSEFNKVQSELEDISSSQGNFDVIVVVVDYLDSSQIETYARNILETHVKDSKKDGGAILMLSMESRDWSICVTGYGYEAISDKYGINLICDKVVPLLSDGKYQKAFLKFGKLCDDFVSEAKDGKAYSKTHKYIAFSDLSNRLLICLAIGIIAALAVTIPLIAQLKSVRNQRTASNYIKEGSFSLNKQQDLFLYDNVTRTKISSSSSGSGGGSRSSGSSGSRSGKF